MTAADAQTGTRSEGIDDLQSTYSRLLLRIELYHVYESVYSKDGKKAAVNAEN